MPLDVGLQLPEGQPGVEFPGSHRAPPPTRLVCSVALQVSGGSKEPSCDSGTSIQDVLGQPSPCRTTVSMTCCGRQARYRDVHSLCASEFHAKQRVSIGWAVEFKIKIRHQRPPEHDSFHRETIELLWYMDYVTCIKNWHAA